MADSSSPSDSPLIEAVKSGSVTKVDSILRTDLSQLNTADQYGMTPLEFACYKGNFEIVKMLIEKGANINSHKHRDGYTALMFAALGGHTDVTQHLLEKGANIAAKNSVGRTASQMAAFVGQHATATLITNFLPEKAISSYSEGANAPLPKNLVEPLLSLVRTRNIHPVHLIQVFHEKKLLLEQASCVVKTLNQMCKDEMEKSDANEPNALKFHILSNILELTSKNVTNSDEESYESFMKKLLKSESKIGLSIGIEKTLRNAVREFPFRDSTIFLQLLRSLSGVNIGDEPSALTLLTRMVSGIMSDNDTDHRCNACHEPNSSKKCSQCDCASYCNRFCQKLHWPCHKKFCKKQTETKIFNFN